MNEGEMLTKIEKILLSSLSSHLVWNPIQMIKLRYIRTFRGILLYNQKT